MLVEAEDVKLIGDCNSVVNEKENEKKIPTLTEDVVFDISDRKKLSNGRLEVFI